MKSTIIISLWDNNHFFTRYATYSERSLFVSVGFKMSFNALCSLELGEAVCAYCNNNQ